jgi:hypothetical protein
MPRRHCSAASAAASRRARDGERPGPRPGPRRRVAAGGGARLLLRPRRLAARVEAPDRARRGSRHVVVWRARAGPRRARAGP